MLNQKEAVFSAYNACSGDKKAMTEMLVEQFNAGEISLSSPQADMKKYVVGLINNWMRKDTRLNGGEKYVTKNPGSRTGANDPVIRNLKNLLQQEGIDDDAKALIQEEIAKRTVAKQIAKPTVNLDLIPAELREKLNIE